MNLWHVDPSRKREVWTNGRNTYAVYWDINDDRALVWHLHSDRTTDPMVYSLFELVNNGYVKN